MQFAMQYADANGIEMVAQIVRGYFANTAILVGGGFVLCRLARFL